MEALAVKLYGIWTSFSMPNGKMVIVGLEPEQLLQLHTVTNMSSLRLQLEMPILSLIVKVSQGRINAPM